MEYSMTERTIYKWKYSVRRGWGSMCWEYGWGCLLDALWYQCDCWTLCFWTF
jgi:hypothetical protein